MSFGFHFKKDKNALLNFILFVSLIIFVFVLYYLNTISMIIRSAGGDESLLLANFFNGVEFNILKPLPLYDQAGSLFSTILLKISTQLFGTEIIAIRYFVLSIYLFGFYYFLYSIIKTYGWIAGISVSLLSIGSYELFFYSTEIKHYAFEISGTYILLGWFFLYLNRTEKNIQILDLLILSLGLFLGISTLFILISIIFTISFISYKYKVTQLKHIGILVLLILLAISYKYLISYYAQFQMYNYPDSYNTSSAIDSLNKVFRRLYQVSYSVTLAIFGFLYLYLLYFNKLNKNINIAIAFLMTIYLFVFFASGLGLYPAYSVRQVAWLIPVGISIISIIVAINPKRKYYLVLVFIAALGYYLPFSANPFVKYGNYKDATISASDTNALYFRLSQLKSGNVLVYSGAQASLEVYKNIFPELHKHKYIGLINNKSGLKLDEDEFKKNYEQHITSSPGSWGSHSYFRVSKNNDLYSEWSLKQTCGIDDFYILISHLNKKSRRDSFFKYIEARNCQTTSIFSAQGVEILNCSCDVLNAKSNKTLCKGDI